MGCYFCNGGNEANLSRFVVSTARARLDGGLAAGVFRL